ncbi:MAG: reductive dehalogenase, partial [Pseudomonadota bacterium]
YTDGPHPFETLKRIEKPTTYIDEPNVARVPKRADLFARAQFGDMGPDLQKAATGGFYVRKAGQATALRRPLGALVLLQDGPHADVVPDCAKDPKTNADAIKAASYFLGADAVGISRCPDWTWYSHDATGAEIHPNQNNAISMIIDQGFETTEGSSGDDWIAVTQSMRAYLRFSLVGSVIARMIRNMGYSARSHTVLDGEVLQPPLLLLSGLGEVSRIGEVIVNPFLGPRLKSGVVTTDMPLDHDLPIDFGMQAFCEACNKCARECPSGAITAGPKLMFNGYEIWKSDSQKCTTYRVTNPAGAMCGRCMKTCPWNVEGLLHEGPIRWTAMNIPAMAPLLACADDKVGNGAINSVKKWWWDLKLNDQGGYDMVDPVADPPNMRALQPELDLKYEDQTLAVYPASQAPHPWPFPFNMDREKGIEAYQAMITAEEYQTRKARGETGNWDHKYANDGDAPVLRVEVTKADRMANGVTKYEFQALDRSDLPEWTAGAHLDIVVAPEFLRQYSMSGDPADRSKYQIGVLREDAGRGGSKLLHRIFEVGRKVFISKPINHFPRHVGAKKHFF